MILRSYARNVSTLAKKTSIYKGVAANLDDGRFALMEFKLGSREIEEGAKHLLQIKDLIKKHNQDESQAPLREPDLMMIATGGEKAYTRPDRVRVIPIGTLQN